MHEFAAAALTFLAAHLVPAVPALRPTLVAALGRGAYLAIYSVVSVALLAWLIVAARRADTVILWDPAPWQWYAALALMPAAVFLLVVGVLTPNPLSISFRRAERPGAMAGITRHPILWAFLLWALAHIPPNGDLVSLVLFGGMAAFSLTGFFSLDARSRRRLGRERWRDLARDAPLVPLASPGGRRAARATAPQLVGAAIVALIAYVWFLLHAHRALIGVAPLAYLGL
ncbi:MAG TPA: NnrU family protein [Salinarimonas sp.]|nr:NnrU family protein [Salinarimonas sp.]